MVIDCSVVCNGLIGTKSVKRSRRASSHSDTNCECISLSDTVFGTEHSDVVCLYYVVGNEVYRFVLNYFWVYI